MARWKPNDACGVCETARVARWLADESAGQCGPCVHGLPSIASGLTELAGLRPRAAILADVERWAGLVVGRGACAHPDGTVRLVRSALTTFADELNARRLLGTWEVTGGGATRRYEFTNKFTAWTAASASSGSGLDWTTRPMIPPSFRMIACSTTRPSVPAASARVG